MTIGTVLLAAGLTVTLVGAGAAYLVIGGQRAALRWARWMSYSALFLSGLSSVLLMGLILSQRYEFTYVYSYTSRDLGLFYRISAFWAGQEGSFLLWLLLGSILTVLQIRRSRQFEPYVLLFLLLAQAGLTVFLLVDSPFRLMGQVEADGFGMNPLLQNPWMVVHPPVLFVGYAGLAIPFAYALAGLWRRDYDAWVGPALPWTLGGWFFLGLGIYLGAYWAYETLGWGGYWAWDLVENSSLIPWLTGTALLHAMLIQRYRQRLRHTNFILAISTFLLILYATYLTRSGVLSEISTHSFVESGLSPWMIGLLALMAVIGVGLLISRWSDIPRSPVFTDSAKKPLLDGDVEGTVGAGLRSWFSRDFTFLVTLLVLVLVALPVFGGTLVPIASRVLGQPGGKVDESFYPLTTGPSVALLLAVLSVCPLLGWRGSDWSRLRRFLLWPAIFAIASTLGAVLLGAHQPISLLFVLLGAFALASNVVMIVRTARGGVLRLGGYLAHIGLGLLVVGIIASSMYAQDGPSMELPQGQSREVLGYRLTFLGWQEEPGRHPALRLEVERGQDRFVALPEMYLNPQDNSLVATPHVARYLTHDLYIAAEGYVPGGGEEEVVVGEGESVQVAGYTLTLQALIPADPYVQVALAAELGEKTVAITPTFAVDTTVPGQPASLPDGSDLSVSDLYMPPPGLLMLVEGQPVAAGPYTVTLQGFTMQPHDDASGAIAAGAKLQFIGPEGASLITPTQIMGGPQGPEYPPVSLSPGVTVRLTQIAVEQRAAWVQLEGLDLPAQPGVAWLRLQGAAGDLGVARVRMSIKPGINFLWLGGIVLLLGTALATVRRWWDGRQQ